MQQEAHSPAGIALRLTKRLCLTVAEIAAHFAALDKPIGTVTIYRQLERLVEDKELRDRISSGAKKYVYENKLTKNTKVAEVYER